MEPIALWVRDDGEMSLLHRCSRCGVIKANRVAGDDDEEAIGALVRRVGQAGRVGRLGRAVRRVGPAGRVAAR
jgi:hypothetical protein